MKNESKAALSTHFGISQPGEAFDHGSALRKVQRESLNNAIDNAGFRR
jgi:hypothetical protein